MKKRRQMQEMAVFYDKDWCSLVGTSALFQNVFNML